MPSFTSPVPKIASRSVFTWVITSLLVIGVVSAMTFVSGARVKEAGSSYYEPVGYVKQVMSLLEFPPSKELPAGQHGPLRHEDSAPGPDQVLPRWGRLYFDDSQANAYQREFYGLSKRLRNDIQLFNESGEGFFQFGNDDTARPAPNYHKFALPYPRRESWRGSITLGEEARPSLIGEGLYLGFTPQEKYAPPQPKDIITLPVNAWTAGAKNRPHNDGSSYNLVSDDGSPVLSFNATGPLVQMQVYDRALQMVYLNGDLVNRRGEGVKVLTQRREGMPKELVMANSAPLQDGDRIRIKLPDNGREITLRFGKYAGSMVTRSWLEDGKAVNLVDADLARTMPYLADLQAALNRYVEAHPKPGSIGQPNIRITLDRDLHSGLSKEFLNYVRHFDATRSSVRNIQIEPASLCVVNALNGDVLAMPSYPAPEDIEDLRQRLHSRSISGLSEAKLRRLAINQNLSLIPIGSTTKPLFATAIWDTLPETRKLKVHESGGKRNDVFDHHFEMGYDTVGPRDVDARTFLRYSSNDFTAHLGLLMLAGPGVKLGSDGRPAGGRLDLGNILKGDSIPGGLSEQKVPTLTKFAQCWDCVLTSELDKGPEQTWDAAPLGTMFRQIGANGELLYRCFSDVMPQRAVLGIDGIVNVRGKFLAMMLGSGSNYWSNLMLAQAYSRVGTGRMINVRLATDPKDHTRLEDFPPLPVKKDTLDMVHLGMKECAEGFEGSTAERIGATVKAAQAKFEKRGLKLVALSKTGTAARVGPVTDSHKNIIEAKRECAAFCLYLEVNDGKGHVLAALTSALYMQDRAATIGNGSPRNSAVAVELSKEFFPQLITWLEKQPGVADALAKK